MTYALGQRARAMCDRCGFEVPYRDLVEEWNGLKTCPSCFDEKHPQEQPRAHLPDPEALYDPRPDSDVEAGQGFVYIDSWSMDPTKGINSSIGMGFDGIRATLSVGDVTVTTT